MTTELRQEAGVAPSITPPGTAAVRDFSHLAPQIPELDAVRCVGCMTCVSACPDSAIMGIALPDTQLDGLVSTFAATQPDPDLAGATARGRFARTTKYADLPARRGLEPAGFGIFVDPVHCKGCGECVEVCHALGYDALRMADKVAREASGESTLDRFSRDMALFRSLPPTPEAYRSEKALADLMLGEHAFGYVGGAGSCAGRGEAAAIRNLLVAGPLGPGRSPGAPHLGAGWRRGDVRHRLSGPVADGRLRRRYQGDGARHAGLLEHRRPGLHRQLRRPGDQVLRFWA